MLKPHTCMWKVEHEPFKHKEAISFVQLLAQAKQFEMVETVIVQHGPLQGPAVWCMFSPLGIFVFAMIAHLRFLTCNVQQCFLIPRIHETVQHTLEQFDVGV